jgi:pseudouridine synthase
MTDKSSRPVKSPTVRSTVQSAPRPWRPSKPVGLARALLKAGYGTRRQTEQMVEQGRVRVGDDVVTDPRQMVDVGSEIYLDDEPLLRLTQRYFALHKPLRVFCGVTDGAERKQLTELFPAEIPGLTAAGRMDSKTTGLILVSNDRAWNNMITTTHGLEQEYRVQFEGELSELEISVMTAGVHLPGLGLFRPESVRIVEILNGRTVVNMTVGEGKIRQVRRMLSTLRHRVTMVRRTRIGDIRLADLHVGAYRELSNPEIVSIREIHAAMKRRSSSTGG